jgi:hypothetical protein
LILVSGLSERTQASNRKAPSWNPLLQSRSPSQSSHNYLLLNAIELMWRNTLLMPQAKDTAPAPTDAAFSRQPLPSLRMPSTTMEVRMEHVNAEKLAERLSGEGMDYWIHIEADSNLDKYPGTLRNLVVFLPR